MVQWNHIGTVDSVFNRNIPNAIHTKKSLYFAFRIVGVKVYLITIFFFTTNRQGGRKLTLGRCVCRGWEGLTDISSGYEVMLPLKLSKTKFPSLLIRFIMTIDGKYKKRLVELP